MRATDYIVKTATANMPNSCWGRYGRIAVLEVELGVMDVSMISDRAKGVVRVVKTWERRNIGKTIECAFSRALEEANMLVERLAAEAFDPFNPRDLLFEV